MPLRIVLTSWVLVLMAIAGIPAARTVARTPGPLQGLVAGRPLSCIRIDDTYDSQAVSNKMILFHTPDKGIYRNDLRRACPHLMETVVAFAPSYTRNDRLCDDDVIQVFDLEAHTPLGACQLGKFAPYALPKNTHHR